ncbi:putative amidophosphoribosyltransferase [Marmoricola sp. OAE513]
MAFWFHRRVNCPHCAQEIAPGTVVCPHCRTVLHPESVPAAARQEEPRQDDPLGAGGYFFLGFAGVIVSGLSWATPRPTPAS